jgi:hypothetical protein
MMIHDPWAIAMGGPADMRKMADTLDQVKDAILATYVDRTGGDEEKIAAMMTEETWLNADEAVELGFADSMGEDVDVAALARNDLKPFAKVYRHVPDTLRTAAAVFESGPLLPEIDRVAQEAIDAKLKVHRDKHPIPA